MGSLKNFLRKIFFIFFQKNSTIYKWVYTKYRHGIFAPPNTTSIATIISQYNEEKKSKVFFVQIGANNGVSNDPLNEFILNSGWSGILIEPLPDVFGVLKENYKETKADLLFENVAIGSVNGEVPFFYIDNSDQTLPVWTSQLSSFNRDVVVKNLGGHPQFIGRIKSINIETLTLAALLKKHGLSKIDLLHTDTEGFDYEILKTIDFSIIHPDIIMFESIHLSKADFKATVSILKNANYAVFVCGHDSIAICKTMGSVLKKANS